MRTPIRKPGKYTHNQTDAHMTEYKLSDLKQNLEKLIKDIRPRLAKEVKILSQTGDYSENAGYQMAKGRLRGINQRILDIEDLIKRAVIITEESNHKVHIGSYVTLEIEGKIRVYQILGATETDPSKGVISFQSALGAALMSRQVGDVIEIELPKKIIKYLIKKIE